MLSALNLSVSLSGRTVLSDVTLTLRPGELIVVAGPNGAGKSTLLKALTGTLAPAGGQVLFDGRPLSRWTRRELARRRAVLAQSHHVAFPFTVFEMVMLGLLAADGIDAETRRRRALDCLAAVDLAGYEGRLFQELSGGEQQRVQIARVLCQIGGPVAAERMREAPCWLFLDEPTASLDIGHQLAILDLARAQAKAGGGAFAILHDLNLASLYADRLIVLSDGRVAGDGPPQAVLTEAFVRSVFSERVRVVADGDRRYVLPMAAEG